MQLSSEQIQVLFDFTKKKYVHFYDLQLEIVDHLAAAIEDKICEDNKMSFEQALQEVYSNFGIFGFAHVVREKEKQIDRQANSMLWKEIVSLFTWPHLLFSMLVLVSLYTLTLFFIVKTILIVTLLISLILLPFYLRTLFKQIKPKKSLRILAYYKPGLELIPYIYVQLVLHLNWISGTAYVLISFFSFIFVVASYKVNAKIKSNALELYPEAFVLEISN